MPPTVPGPTNTYIVNEAATKNMLVDFARNPNKFALAEYGQYVPVDKMAGAYTEMVVEMAGRVLATDGSDALWRPGSDAPSFEGWLEDFYKRQYATNRYAEGFRIARETKDQAPWDVVAQASRQAYQRTMTRRTLLTVTALTTAGNMLSGHALDLDSPPSGITGKLDVATVANSNIKRTMDYCTDLIHKKTLGAVEPEDIMFLLSPNMARRMSVAPEIRDYIKQSPAAEKTVRGELGPKNNWGFPEELYGYRTIVEKTVRVSSVRGAASTTYSYVMPDSLVAVSRVGGLEAPDSGPSFSSVQLFFFEEGTIEDRYDENNRRHEGRVVDNYAVNLTSKLSTVLVENVLSS